jgi:hypothetical protein
MICIGDLVKPKYVRSLILLPGIIFILSACLPSVTAESPSSLPEPGAVETIIFETAAAARTQTAQFLPPTQTITNTPTPQKHPPKRRHQPPQSFFFSQQIRR